MFKLLKRVLRCTFQKLYRLRYDLIGLEAKGKQQSKGVNFLYVIETKNLTKRFGNFTANSKINLRVKKGEIHAIVGENGAGKSTLMNMLYGLLQPTEGEILINGKSQTINNPRDAIKLGIGMVHQHFKLVPSFTVYENILLGDEITKGIRINKKKEIEVIQKLIDDYGFNINPRDKVQNVSIGTEQRVEILKMLYRDVDILILDEPTAVLTPQEVKELLANLRKLKEIGKTIIIITHKLNEVKECSDSVTVIRKGQIIDRVDTKDVSEKDLAKLMVGRDVSLKVAKPDAHVGEEMLRVDQLSVTNKDKIKLLSDVSFSVRRGQILGIAGVEGNGQSELIKVLTGLMTCTGGKVHYKDKDITNIRPEDIRKLGVGIIPEDRYKHGLCKEMKISENLIAGYHDTSFFGPPMHLDHKKIKNNRDKMIDAYDIRVAQRDGNVGQLSGGNAQKVIIARELSMEPAIVIASQPTRGVDIGSIEFIHNELIKLRNEGKAVIVVSSELSEILNLSDRIAVMYKGSIIGEVDAKETTKEELGFLMAGITDKEVKE